MANAPTPLAKQNTARTASSQPRMKLPVTLGTSADLPNGEAKAITVHTANGGRVTLNYVPADNDASDQAITCSVPSDWVSDTSVKRVNTATAASGDTVTVWALYS